MKKQLRLIALSGLALGAGLADTARAQCVATTLDFATQPANDSWKAHAAQAAPTGTTLTTISSGSYASGAIAAETTLDTQALNGVQTLYWRNLYTAASAVNTRVSTVTFTFNRPVANLSVSLLDVDMAAGFLDEVTFAGSNSGVAAAVSLTKPTGSTVSIAGTVATGTTDVSNTTDGNVTATFTGSITTLTLTYRNITTDATVSQQFVGLTNIAWCRLTPVAANIVNSPTMANTASATDIDSPSAVSEGTNATFTVTQIPSTGQGALTYYNAGILGIIAAGYQPVTNGITLTPTQAASLRFDPMNPYTGSNAVFRYTSTDDAGAVSNEARFTIPVTGALPVELTWFEATAVATTAQLSWSTASEKNNDRFDVERSLSGTDFVKIGQVASQGSPSVPTNYRYLDAGIGAKAQGLVYYRLRQVDNDKSSAYSPVRIVRFAPNAEVALGIYPNPTSGHDRAIVLNLGSLPQGTYPATVLDATGRVLATYSVEGGSTQDVNVQALQAGSYFIRVRGNGLNLTQHLTR